MFEKTFIPSKPAVVLNRLGGNGSMLSNIFKKGILVGASKLVVVLNKIAGSESMLAWYQDKPIEVLNRPVGSGLMLSKNLKQGSSINASKLVGVLNRLLEVGLCLHGTKINPSGY